MPHLVHKEGKPQEFASFTCLPSPQALPSSEPPPIRCETDVFQSTSIEEVRQGISESLEKLRKLQLGSATNPAHPCVSQDAGFLSLISNVLRKTFDMICSAPAPVPAQPGDNEEDRAKPHTAHATPETLLECFFDTPAHIAQPEFGLCTQPLDADGVVIYEGMRFVADSQGRYYVSFTATAVGMPVTLRLQLHLRRHDGQVHTLTLPPIVLDDQNRIPSGNYLGETFRVQHSGYSDVVRTQFNSLQTIHREATARFGPFPPRSMLLSTLRR